MAFIELRDNFIYVKYICSHAEYNLLTASTVAIRSKAMLSPAFVQIRDALAQVPFVAHLEVLNRVAQFIPVGFAGPLPVAPAVEGESEGGHAMGPLRTDGTTEFYPALS